MSDCPRCAGHLVAPNHPDAHKPSEFHPCPLCLRVVATDEIKAVAFRAFGITEREKFCDNWPPFEAWWRDPGGPDKPWVEVVPLDLTMGYDLGLRVLAERVNLEGSAFLWGWNLLGWGLRNDRSESVVFPRRELPDVSDDLQRIRALALQLGVVPSARKS